MTHTKHIVLFLLDGCRPDAIATASTPEIDRLIAQGASTMAAQTVMPSITLPCHTSLFFSAKPEQHGVQRNVWQRPPSPEQSLFEVIYQAGLGAASFHSWEELRDLAAPSALDFSYFFRLDAPIGDRILKIAQVAADYLVQEKPAFSFVYLEATDSCGHRYGWMSDEYLAAVEKSDQAISLVRAAAEAAGLQDDTTFIVQADHGGHDHGHGTDAPEDMTIPWIISGPGIRPGHQIDTPVNIIDVAPTILHMLALEKPDDWQGNLIAQALL